ncbi:hypothetical protein [Pedobacter sp. WC2423]|uniref:hypothetical protein n=1 Tax=Pedobacter sp. WC2423 TaxID=3234142 RepID=UPI0034659C4E
MKKRLFKKTDLILPSKKVTDKPHGPIILFGYISEPPEGGGGGGGGWDPNYPTYPGTGGGGGESTGDGAGGTLPSGNLSSDYQEQVSDAFWAPPIVSFVRFTVYPSGAATPNVVVRTRSLGNYMTKTTIPFTATTRTVDVGLYASNTQVHVYFQTTDSNGGSCHWQAMHS